MTQQDTAQNRSKIVIGVEDAPENLVVLRASIERAGFTFVGVQSGMNCLELTGRLMPRLIILDIDMPEMNGFETCRRLRTRPELKSVPIMFLTASNSPDDVRRGLAAGGNDFMIKPFHPAKLLQRVQHWTSRRAD